MHNKRGGWGGEGRGEEDEEEEEKRSFSAGRWGPHAMRAVWRSMRRIRFQPKVQPTIRAAQCNAI